MILLYYCGGVRTEPDYFNALQRQKRRSSVTVRVRQDGVAPDALVRAAAAYRDRDPGVFDEMRCVVDGDDFGLAGAAAEARRRFSLGIDDAIRRAQALEPTGKAYGKNPSSDVWQVVEKVMEPR